ncbi:MAG TPA: TonB-dependent receptor [Pyrinomonadaceae bacterium]|nr:TonB-dependent receptor [Chloracidobacterium sp.]MBP9934441.1 TonB-dependent receptor [Pyrinomonadaceae bacterium]MBK9437431.1 TonB-dependent receptor [Chloracidobacterium sp.]MBK9766160.1 TonB-dependent receptor [Chloracidobacterium sp.]MBL0240101.1 TonB-dependent receptor [Chloracidobacterium sp.]
MKVIKNIIFTGLIVAMAAIVSLAQTTGSIGGSVTDSLGAVVVGATVTAISPTGTQKSIITNARGEYNFTGLTAGKYTVKAIAPKFALYENTEVDVVAGEKFDLFVVLTVSGVEETVDVSNNEAVSNEADNNADATVLKGKDLDSLPDDPDELQAALQALAGPSAGPNGGQIYIDGFTGGQLPPKESIREIRINQNPFSAEFDRPGFGRIEILTKPGSDKFRGSVNGNFNDESLNSRNPFAANKAPSQLRSFGGNLSGPIKKGKSSFFLDVSNRDVDNNAIINAVVLDSAFNPVNFSQDLTIPSRRFSIGPRVDFAINDKNTLVARYSFDRSTNKNQGIGDTSLPSRAYDTTGFGHELRLTETAILNAKTVNETRFQYSFDKRSQNGDNSIPTVSVAAAFTGGGAQIGSSANTRNAWELSNNTTTSFGKNSQHSVKFGVRLRNTSINDRSENNYGGTYVFPGFFGADPYDLNSDGIVSPLEQYRARVLGAVGTQYDPTQFSITTGDPLAKVSRFDAGLFVTDDWRISPSLLFSFGLRYENQTNINDSKNFAPRIGLAWSPGAGGAKPPKTVFRLGAGVFYERFSENLTLQAERFNGTRQLNLIVSANDPDPIRRAAALALLSQPLFTTAGVTNSPTAAQILAALPQSNTIRTIDSGLSVPYTMQATLGIERQLPFKTSLGAFFITSRTIHQLRIRNINAPICPLQINCANAPRPQPGLGNIYEYEASGINNQNQLIMNFRSAISPRISLFGNYRLGFANSDTDGSGSFPAYSYDFTGEYGRAAFDVRHNFVIGGNITLPWQISLNPFITASSGRPFNITRGVDLNGDSLFTERPTYGELGARCSELQITASYCNVAGNDPNLIIPRNYGEGSSYFSVNLRVGKTFGFGGKSAASTAAAGGNRGGGATGGPPAGVMMGGGGRGMGGGMGGMFGGGDGRKPYNLNLSVNFNNLLNNVNFNTPVGSLSSGRFGQSTNIAGGYGGFGGGGGTANRRIELQARFSW